MKYALLCPGQGSQFVGMGKELFSSSEFAKTCYHKASEILETGCVAINTPVVAVAEAPFGGIKQTGYGREGGSMAIKDYLNIKYTHFGISYE